MAEHSDRELAAVACGHLSIETLTAREVWLLTQAVRHYEQDGRLTLCERAALYEILFRHMITVEL